MSYAQQPGAEYRYRGHLLVEHRLPTGLTYCYVYDGDTHEAWCVESWGERIGTTDPALAIPIPPRPAAGPDSFTSDGGHIVNFQDEDGLGHVFDSRNGAVTSRLYDARGNLTFVQCSTPTGRRSSTSTTSAA